MLSMLNQQALAIADDLALRCNRLRVAVQQTGNGARIIDCGIQVPGSLEAGRLLAECCLADLGRVQLAPGPSITVSTDQPVAACMASQYAGWQIVGTKFFAMGSGPMRAAGSREPLFEEIGHRERPERVVGILESRKLPPDEVCAQIASDCGVSPQQLTLLVAPTASLAGTIQIVARSVETALHKMHAVGFKLENIVSGFGSSPLPPVAKDDLVGIGRTNDAILYGAEVTIWLRDEDRRISELGPKLPSSASTDYGEPFSAIFERYGRDFYKIDPLLFSPAKIVLNNLSSGRAFSFGATNPAVLATSFGS